MDEEIISNNGEIKNEELQNSENENSSISKEEEKKEENNQIQLTEFAIFRNEICTQIQDITNKVNTKIQEQQNEITNTMNTLKEEINKIIDKNNYFSEKIINIKLQNEKIEDYETFKKKTESQLITHEIHLNETMKDLSNAKFKYDKIFIENLTVPGYIGQASQYKNVGEFLNHVINEISSLNSEKIQMKNDIKDLKKKSENNIKDVISINNTTFKRCNEYSDKRDIILEDKMKNELKLINEKIMDLRIENVKSAMNLEKKTSEFVNEFDKILNLKNEVENKVKDNINLFKKDADVAIKRYNDMKIEFNKIKSRFGDIVDFIKDIRFGKNLNNIVKKEEIKQLTNKLSFKRKDSKNSQDLENVDLNFDINKKENKTEFPSRHHSRENSDNTRRYILTQNNFYKKSSDINSTFSNFNQNLNNNYNNIQNPYNNINNIVINKDYIDNNIENNIDNNIDSNQQLIKEYKSYDPIIKKENNKNVKNYSLVEMNITDENNFFNPGLIITKNNLNIKKKFRTQELITSDNNFFNRDKKKNKTFVQMKSNNNMQSFGRTLTSFNKDYINCTDTRPKSKTYNSPEENLNVGLIPTSKMKLKIRSPHH